MQGSGAGPSNAGLTAVGPTTYSSHGALSEIDIDVATQFGQGLGFGIGLAILSIIFWPLLGFGDYEYQGAAGAA